MHTIYYIPFIHRIFQSNTEHDIMFVAISYHGAEPIILWLSQQIPVNFNQQKGIHKGFLMPSNSDCMSTPNPSLILSHFHALETMKYQKRSGSRLPTKSEY